MDSLTAGAGQVSVAPAGPAVRLPSSQGAAYTPSRRQPTVGDSNAIELPGLTSVAVDTGAFVGAVTGVLVAAVTSAGRTRDA